jgi:hypothetical protein
LNMTRVAETRASRRGRIILSALVLYLGWQAWLSIQATGKIAPDARQAVSPRGTVDLLVTLPFPPERFHIMVFQRYGRVSGTSENTAEVRGVKLRDVTGLARYYWVRRVEALPDSRRLPSSG